MRKVWLWVQTVSMLLFISNNAFSQSLINSTGSTLSDGKYTIEYAIGEIAVNTLSDNQNNLTQGLLQPIIRIKDCNLLTFIPTAFTPNNDNLNDCFGVKQWPLTTSYQFEVFGRWGQSVFKTNNIAACWNGTFNGQPQPMGAYVYMLKATTSVCGTISAKGSILLIR